MSFAENVQMVLAAVTLPWTVAFVILYARDPWWRGWFGRSLMILAVGVFLGSMVVVLYRLFGVYPYRDLLIVAYQALVLIAMVIRTLVLWHAQAHDRPARH